jgi:hypothetical protein
VQFLRVVIVIGWGVLGALALGAIWAALAGVIRTGELVVALIASGLGALGLLYNTRWLRRWWGGGAKEADP